jgi:hypothetical protein
LETKSRAKTGIILGLIFLQDDETRPTGDNTVFFETKGILDEFDTQQQFATSF